MIDTTNIDNADVFATENRYADILKEKGVDAPPGSAVRELVVRPSAVLEAIETEWRAELVASLDLNAIADGTVSGDDGLLDAIASIYRMTRLDGSSSTGVMALTIDYQGYAVYINQSWTFTANGHTLSFNGVYAGSIDGTEGDGQVNRQRLIRTASGVDDSGQVQYSYTMLVPVFCEDGAEIAAGTPVTWNGPSEAVVGAFVFAPVTGGGTVETNQSLAKRILEALPPGVMSTPLQIRNTFATQFGIPVDRTAVIGGQEGLTRAKDRLTGILLPGFVDVFVAVPGDCPSETVPVTPSYVEDGVWSISLESPLASGAYDVSSLVVDGVPLSSEAMTVSYGVDDHDGHIVPSGTQIFSSFQTMTITFQYAGSADNPPECVLTLNKQPLVQTLQDYADSTDRRAPGQDLVVKAATPFYLTASVVIEGGSSVDEDTIKTAICSYVNALPVGRGFVSGQDFVDAVASLGVRVAFPINLSVRVRTGSSEVSVTADDGRLDVGFLAPGRGVFYLSMDRLRITANES